MKWSGQKSYLPLALNALFARIVTASVQGVAILLSGEEDAAHKPLRVEPGPGGLV